MDAVKFIEERNRMCKSYGSKCGKCPANFDNMFCCGVAAISTLDAAVQIAIVEKWSIEHPKKQKKTRQDVFLEQYPDTFRDNHGVIAICPMNISTTYRNCDGLCRYSDRIFVTAKMCMDCRREFWTQEVKENK